MTYSPKLRIVPLNEWPPADQVRWSDAVRLIDILQSPSPLAHYSLYQLRRKKWAYGRWLGFATSRLSGTLLASGLDAMTPTTLRSFIGTLNTLFAPYTIAGYVSDLEIVVRAFQGECDFLHTAATTLRRLGRPARDKRPRLRPSSELYQLGLDLMRDAGGQVGPRVAARTFQDGLIVALLAARPIRLKNLASIEIERHLTRHGDLYWLTFPARETKTHRHLEFPLPAELGKAVEQHLNFYRPILLKNLGRWNSSPHAGLWVSEHGSKLCENGVYRRVYDRTVQRFGTPLSPHLFRDSAATSVAIEDPGHVGIVTTILGHSNAKTAETYYNQATSLEAARHHQAVVHHFRSISARGG